MKRILLIRQGNKTSTNSTISSKRKDLVMSELGKSQVRSLTKYFSENKKMYLWSEVFCSDYPRAVSTAISINSYLQKKITIIEGLGERYFCDQELTENESFIELKKMQENWGYAPSGGETLSECVDRFETSINLILSKTDEGRTAVIVSHGRIMQAFLHCLFPRYQINFNSYQLIIKETSLTSLLYSDRFELEYFNRTDHLR
ncbi:MAG: histidine phosphatase family protein [Thermales bacterium]|nr:histidine phosphatase family protein [Thermales bacterium]